MKLTSAEKFVLTSLGILFVVVALLYYFSDRPWITLHAQAEEVKIEEIKEPDVQQMSSIISPDFTTASISWPVAPEGVQYVNATYDEPLSSTTPFTVTAMFAVERSPGDAIDPLSVYCDDVEHVVVPTFISNNFGVDLGVANLVVMAPLSLHCNEAYQSQGEATMLQYVPYDTRVTTSPSFSQGEAMISFLLLLILTTLVFHTFWARLFGTKLSVPFYRTFLGNNSKEGKEIKHI